MKKLIVSVKEWENGPLFSGGKYKESKHWEKLFDKEEYINFCLKCDDIRVEISVEEV